MPSIDSIAADYVERAAVLDPAFATWAGITGHDDQLPDLSPEGFAGRAELDRSALAALEAVEVPGQREQVARAAMRERLTIAVERYDAGGHHQRAQRDRQLGAVRARALRCDAHRGRGRRRQHRPAHGRGPGGLPSALADLARRGPERPSPGPAAGRGGRQAVRQLVRSS